jgi:branched-chain amino acid transport system substrate-binding protein
MAIKKNEQAAQTSRRREDAMGNWWVRTPGICLGIVALAAASPASAQDEIKIGAFLPVTGVTADVGAQMKAGIEVAVERANAAGVKLDKLYKLRVIFYDTEGKGDVGLNVVTRALSVDKINVGVGFISSDVFTRVMDEFQKAKVPVVDCCAASLKVGDKIAERKMTHVFQLSPTASDIAKSVAAAVSEAVKPTKVAMLNENTDSGRDFSGTAKQWFAAHAPNVQVVADEFVEHGATDMTPQMAKFKRLGAQAIIGEIYGSSAPILYEQWYELKVPATIAHMGATAAAGSFIQENGKYMEHSIVNVRWWPAVYSPVSEPMMAAYKKKTGRDPTNFSVQAHDSALVAIDAIEKAASLDADKISVVLSATTFQTAWGDRKFTSLEAGHRMPIETVVAQVQNGKAVPIYPDAVAKSAGGGYKPVPPYAWEKK